MASSIDQVFTDQTYNAKAAAVSGNASMDKDAFLKLMIAQLKNQDPLNPMDGTEYASQLAQFSSLEQLTNLNDSVKQNMDANYYLTQSINNTLIANLVGNEVKVSASSINYSGQDNMELSYTLPNYASKASINIYDANGTLVKSIDDISMAKGENKLSWDFTDNNGAKVPAGTYTAKVEAYDVATGDKMDVGLYKYGTIDGVRFGEMGTILIVDSMEYNLSDIAEILKGKN